METFRGGGGISPPKNAVRLGFVNLVSWLTCMMAGICKIHQMRINRSAGTKEADNEMTGEGGEGGLSM